MANFIDDFGDSLVNGSQEWVRDGSDRQYYTGEIIASNTIVCNTPYPVYIDEAYCIKTNSTYWGVARQWTTQGDTYIDTSILLGNTTGNSKITIQPNYYYLFQFGKVGGGDVSVNEIKSIITDIEMWTLDENDILTNENLPNPIDWQPPYPAGMWVLDDNDILTNSMLPEALIDYQGAFNKCAHLVEVTIPKTVKSIGEWSFRETALTSVTIASDCTYYDTSFPENCVINFYPD